VTAGGGGGRGALEPTRGGATGYKTARLLGNGDAALGVAMAGPGGSTMGQFCGACPDDG